MLNTSVIKVIGFDLDQTLYPKSTEIDEAIQIYLYHKISDHLKVDLDEARKLFKDLYKDGSGLSGSQTLKHLGVPNADNSIQDALENADIVRFLKPNLENNALLKDLKNKYQVDIITGSNTKITFDKLEHLDIDKNLFNKIITADHDKKSSSEAYKLWFTFYPDLKPENFLYIGDRPKTDHFIPIELGIQTILVNQKKINPELNCPQLPSLLELRPLLLGM